MKRGLNRLELIGNVGADDARLSTLPNSGTPVLNFSFAVNDFYKDRQTGEEVPSTVWFKVAIFGERAKALAPFIVRGATLYLAGKVGAKAWQPKDDKQQPTGEPRADLTLKVNELLFIDGNKQADDLSGDVDAEATGADDEDLFPKE